MAYRQSRTNKGVTDKSLQRTKWRSPGGGGLASGIARLWRRCQEKNEPKKTLVTRKFPKWEGSSCQSPVKTRSGRGFHGSTRIGIGQKPISPRRTQGARRGSGQRQPRMTRMNTGPLGFCFARFGLRPARRPSAERNGGIIHLPTVETVGFDISALPGLRKENPHTSKCGLCGAPGNK